MYDEKSPPLVPGQNSPAGLQTDFSANFAEVPKHELIWTSIGLFAHPAATQWAVAYAAPGRTLIRSFDDFHMSGTAFSLGKDPPPTLTTSLHPKQRSKMNLYCLDDRDRGKDTNTKLKREGSKV